MDKLTTGKILPSNLPWFFNYNKKIAEESKPAGNSDRFSKNKHTNKKTPNNCATVSQEARKDAEPGLHATTG